MAQHESVTKNVCHDSLSFLPPTSFQKPPTTKSFFSFKKLIFRTEKS